MAIQLSNKLKEKRERNGKQSMMFFWCFVERRENKIVANFPMTVCVRVFFSPFIWRLNHRFIWGQHRTVAQEENVIFDTKLILIYPKRTHTYTHMLRWYQILLWHTFHAYRIAIKFHWISHCQRLELIYTNASYIYCVYVCVQHWFDFPFRRICSSRRIENWWQKLLFSFK